MLKSLLSPLMPQPKEQPGAAQLPGGTLNHMLIQRPADAPNMIRPELEALKQRKGKLRGGPAMVITWDERALADYTHLERSAMQREAYMIDSADFMVDSRFQAQKM